MVKLSDIELPMVIPNRLLFSHGVHNNWHIHPVEVEKSLGLTDWKDQKNRSLFLSHSERDAQKWVGRITNPYTKDGELFGDLEIHDADLALKLGPGKAPLGVSAEIRWPKQFMDPTNFSYTSFAMVPNPEVRETQINFSHEDTETGNFKIAKIDAEFKVDTTNFSQDPEIAAILDEQNASKVEDVSEKNTPEEKKQGDNKSDLMSAERGLEKQEMEENNANDVVPEVKEKVEESKVEEVAEEVKEEESDEEDEAEAKFSALEEKYNALSAKIDALESKIAKFSEAEEAKEEVEEEKTEEPEAEVEEAKEETPVEEAKEEVEEEKTEEFSEEEESKEEVEEENAEEESEAKFSEDMVSEIATKVAEAMSKKQAASMTTAEFGTAGNDKNNAVIDRLTNFLEN